MNECFHLCPGFQRRLPGLRNPRGKPTWRRRSSPDLSSLSSSIRWMSSPLGSTISRHNRGLENCKITRFPNWNKPHSCIQCCGSGSVRFWTFRIRILRSSSKNIKKKLDFYCFGILYDFLSLKNEVSVPSKSKKNRKFLFVGILKATDEKSRIWIRKSFVRIRGSGSVQKFHGSTFHNTACT